MKTTPIPNLLAIIAAGLLSGCDKPAADAPPPVAPPVAVTATNAPAPAPASSAAFAKLPGKWLRPDGGYVIEIRSVAADGKMEAGYFNPRSIHIAKAEASPEGAGFKVFIELQDVNYPGSTYTLTYAPLNDQLNGIYYQALQQQSFEVFFTRMKP